ncbi:MAG: hypothetical protein REI11_10175, partial [Patulibacter sp.]|nr:hypothetical protein [Patulibacter sp.]
RTVEIIRASAALADTGGPHPAPGYYGYGPDDAKAATGPGSGPSGGTQANGTAPRPAGSGSPDRPSPTTV